MTYASKASLTVAALLIIAGPALADTVPAPGSYAIQQLAIRGDGCRPGSVAANVSPDNRAFTLLFSDFLVSADPTARLAHKYCEVDMKVKIPSGWALAVATANIRGYASMADAMSFGVVNSVYAMHGSLAATSVMRQRFVGPYDNNYDLQSSLNTASLTFSPCGKSRMMRLRSTIRTHLSPKSNAGGALMTVDSADGEISQTYGLVWKQCNHPDDADDSGNFPTLAINYTGICRSVLKARGGNPIDYYDGSAVGSDDRSATRAAQADAMQQCRADRRQTPQTSCELVPDSCSSSVD